MQKNVTSAGLVFGFAIAIAAVTVFNIGRATPAAADAPACASEPVIARGESSRYIWLARTKARANWRRKVRAMSTLGPNYSVWARASNTEERCLEGPAGTVCIFTGTPCR